MIPEEQPAPGTPCVVDDCARPATLLVDVSDGRELAGEHAVAMCDEHASHWRDGTA
ncbi:MAG: hypothetical protein ACJ735_17010 [Actinomycetes bacterium]